MVCRSQALVLVEGGNPIPPGPLKSSKPAGSKPSLGEAEGRPQRHWAPNHSPVTPRSRSLFRDWQEKVRARKPTSRNTSGTQLAFWEKKMGSPGKWNKPHLNQWNRSIFNQANRKRTPVLRNGWPCCTRSFLIPWLLFSPFKGQTRGKPKRLARHDVHLESMLQPPSFRASLDVFRAHRFDPGGSAAAAPTPSVNGTTSKGPRRASRKCSGFRSLWHTSCWCLRCPKRFRGAPEAPRSAPGKIRGLSRGWGLNQNESGPNPKSGESPGTQEVSGKSRGDALLTWLWVKHAYDTPNARQVETSTQTCSPLVVSFSPIPYGPYPTFCPEFKYK